MFSCPGAARIKEPIPEFFPCQKCSSEVEIWTNEYNRKCGNCGTEVNSDQVPNCVEWCKYAVECVGTKALNRYLKQKETTGENNG